MKEINANNGVFEMMQLPYQPESLNVISANTLAFHHGKHLKTYVENLNKMLPGSGLEGCTLQEVVCRAEGGLFNNAGQVLNHTMYFEQFGVANHEPLDKMKELITKQFGNYETFKQEFEKKGASLFGSGWVWLSLNQQGELVITQEVNAGNPLRAGLRPLLTFDVWEHAYYLDYQNRRADYLAALWQIVDWQVVEDRL